MLIRGGSSDQAFSHSRSARLLVRSRRFAAYAPVADPSSVGHAFRAIGPSEPVELQRGPKRMRLRRALQGNRKDHSMVIRPPKTGMKPTALADKAEIDALIVRGKADPKAVRTLRCRTVAEGRFRQLNYIRNLPPQPVMEDETNDLSAEAGAPNASEALLAAFGSCLAVGIHANAVSQGIPIRSLEVDLEADINTTAVWGAGDLNPKPVGFESIRVLVRIDAEAPRQQLEALVAHASLWSPVANTLHNPVHLDVALA